MEIHRAEVLLLLRLLVLLCLKRDSEAVHLLLGFFKFLVLTAELLLHLLLLVAILAPLVLPPHDCGEAFLEDVVVVGFALQTSLSLAKLLVHLLMLCILRAQLLFYAAISVVNESFLHERMPRSIVRAIGQRLHQIT